MHVGLLSGIARGAWAIEPGFATSFFPVVNTILNGHPLELEADSPMPSIFHQGSLQTAKGGNFSGAPQKSIAIIPIKSVIMKYDAYCGPAGTDTISQWIKNSDNDPRIAAIILDIDSGGGSADAVSYISAVIKNVKKPILAYTGNGMAASAAYWIASNCDEIYSTYPIDQVGSIGTFLTILDWYAYYEKEGLPVHSIYATKSTDKNKDFRQALEGEYKEIRQKFIDVFNENFHTAIKANRAGKIDLKKEDVLTGKLYFADDAVKHGLIDGIKSFDEVIERAYELAETEESTDNNLSSSTISMKNFPILAALLAMSEVESTSEGIHFSEQHLEQIEAALKTGKENADSLTIATSAKENAETALAQMTSDRDSWKQKAENLGGQAGSTATTTSKDGDNHDSSAVDLDSLSHNKAIANNPMFNHSKNS